MIITLIGDTDYVEQDGHREKLLSVLEEHIGEKVSQLFFCGVGHFEMFTLRVGREYQKSHPLTALTLILPCHTSDLDPKHLAMLEVFFDHVLEPPHNLFLGKNSLLRRSKWLLEQTDLVVTHLPCQDESARQFLACAQELGKPILSLTEPSNV